MKVLLTGASGFVGRRVADLLFENGHEVVCVGGIRSKLDESLTSRAAAHFNVDISYDDLSTNLQNAGKIDAAIHTAAIAHRFYDVSGDEYRRINAHGAENVARAAGDLGARHLIHISSVLVYGDLAKQRRLSTAITEAMTGTVNDEYAASKKEGEERVTKIAADTGMDLTILRPSPVIGEGSKGNFRKLVKAIDERRFAQIGAGDNRKSLIYVGDVAKACVRLLTSKNGGAETFNLAAQPITTSEILHRISELLGRRIFPVSIPVHAISLATGIARMTPLRERAEGISASVETWLADAVYSAEAIKDAYGIEPKTTIDEAIGLEVKHYRSNAK